MAVNNDVVAVETKAVVDAAPAVVVVACWATVFAQTVILVMAMVMYLCSWLES